MKRTTQIPFYLIATVVILAFTFSCSSPGQDQTDEEYISSINKWHQQRVASLKKEDSWLSLAGLYRLQEGTQSLGADSSNDVILPPKAAAHLGTVTKQDTVFTLNVQQDGTVTHNGSPVKKLKLKSSDQGEPTIVKHNSFLWYIINRRGKYYIRLKDTKHPNFASFNGIKRYPVSEKWNIRAKFKPFDEPKLISIPDVLGDVYQDTLYGTLEFTVNGNKYSLAPLGHPEKDDEFFIIMGDKTNGESTYGGGRYIYADTPNKNGVTFIDFNKAYNPPCVFTEFATCPLPPAQNCLPIKITAGEKMYDS